MAVLAKHFERRRIGAIDGAADGGTQVTEQQEIATAGAAGDEVIESHPDEQPKAAAITKTFFIYKPSINIIPRDGAIVSSNTLESIQRQENIKVVRHKM